MIHRSLLLIFLFLQVLFSSGQTSLKKKSFSPLPVVCFASDKVEKFHIDIPPEFQNRLKSSKGATADIQVTYFNFPDNAKKTFEYAVSIWENLVESPVPIRIRASWESLGSKVLGSCSATDFFRNFEGVPQMNKYYSIAATEKIMGKELNGNNYDIEASFNKDIKWYLGTTGVTPDTMYNFVSCVLHEITHGLGFSGFFYTSGTKGGYGRSTDKNPSAFDSYIEIANGRRLINPSLFVNPSVEIYNAITSRQLFIGNPIFLNQGAENRPRLYAPSEFSSGSSVYHLDETLYPAGSGNSLMTPMAGKGEGNHYPGDLTLGILDDIGWRNMYIRFNKPVDVETPGQPVNFEVSVTSDYPLDTASLYLIYSFDKFQHHADSLRLMPSVNPAIFKTVLSTPRFPGVVTYFIKARDSKKRLYSVPADAPSYVYDLKVGPDTIKPTVTHQPADFIFSTARTRSIKALVTDNIGIDTVYVEYFINDKAKPPVALLRDSLTRFTGKLSFAGSELKEGDSIRYRIITLDSSSNSNRRTEPSSGYFKIPVEGLFNPVSKYYNDFNIPGSDFLTKDFSIKTETGFNDGALHSPHPYPSPDKDDTYFHFMTWLRYPVILKQGEYMGFDEVVLVEPGDEGSVFGDYNFWDYVIIEGSKNSGETWLPLLKGYDSGSNTNWLELYNSGFSGNNSTISGKKEMFVNRKFNMLSNGNFSAGDTVIIRFRLLSDPYAHGWGWVIDNLSIQVPVPVDELRLSPGHISVFPNPFNNFFTVSIQDNNAFDELSIVVYNQFGQVVSTTMEKNILSGFRKRIDTVNLPAGLYLVVVSGNGQKIVARKLVKQI